LFTRKATAYFSLALGLLGLGLLLNDFQLALLVLPLASLFFFANVWGLPEKIDLALNRQIIPSETFGDEDIRVECQVQNSTSKPLTNLEIQEQVSDRITPERGTNRVSASVGPREKVSVVFEFPPPKRGLYTIGPLTVRVRDPYGFYLLEKRLVAETLAVMPRPEKIQGTPLRPRRVGPWPGTIPSKTLGLGTEFYSMREYLPGDDPKRINWKASARYRELIVNELEAERVTDIMVVLDTDVTFSETAEAELFERGVRAAASMARLLLRQGNRVGLVIQGEERGSVPAAFGRRQERRILYLLASAKPGRAWVPTSYVVNLLARRMLPSRSQIVIISPLLDPDIEGGVRELTSAGYSLLVVSPTPGPASKFESEAQEIAFRIIMLERANTVLTIEKMATVVHWPAWVPLSSRLSKVRRIRPAALA
jgi:uncharacterized protein (DUF58 family)